MGAGLLVFIVANTAIVNSAFVYYHHYHEYSWAYEVCRSTGMRLVRVDSEAKHRQVMEFTKGLENVTVVTKSFRISLKYDVSSGNFINPDEQVNNLDKWADNQPEDPSVNLCVSQYGGQSWRFGKWHTMDCDERRPFVCESGFPLDPDIGEILGYPYAVRSYQKTDNASPCSESDILKSCHYTKHLQDALIYKGFREDIVELCVVKCSYDDMCIGITFTENLKPDSNLPFCIFMKRKQSSLS